MFKNVSFDFKIVIFFSIFYKNRLLQLNELHNVRLFKKSVIGKESIERIIIIAILLVSQKKSNKNPLIFRDSNQAG